MYHVNEFIKGTERIFPPQGRYDYLRYDMNENPEGLPVEFVEEVKKEITPEFLSIYPEPDNFLNKYAAYLGVAPENVMCTNGSDMAIRYLLETFGEVGKKVVTVAPSFEMYWVNSSLLGYVHVPVPYEDDLTIDIQKIVDAIDDDTRIVVLLNPNNPVGNVYTEEEARRVIERAREVGAVVIVDEAYHYFYDGTFLNLVKEYDNVAMLRTFSKLFSIAALRLGVIVGDAKLVGYARNARLSFDANSVALLFAERLLDHPEIEEGLIKAEKEGKAYCLSELQGKGYEVKDCMGNFIFVDPVHDAHEVAKRLEEEHKVLVKTFGSGPLRNKLRVSIGSKKAMSLFLDAFLAVDQA